MLSTTRQWWSTSTSNSQAWSRINRSEMEELERLQLKCVKKILTLPQSTTNSFVFLEFGALPLKYITEKDKLPFFHHISRLKNNDPVKMMLEKMTKCPAEINWWNQINTLLTKYQITWEEAEDTPKERFRIYVRKKIEKAAIEDLGKECKGKKRPTWSTQHLRREYLYIFIQTVRNHMSSPIEIIGYQGRSKL